MINFLFNKKGNTMISVMVSAGLVAIIAAAFLSLIDSQRKQMKYFEQKAELNDFKGALSLAFQNTSTCSFNLSTTSNPAFTFDSTLPNPMDRKIDIGVLRAGATLTSPKLFEATKKTSTGVLVDKVQLLNFIDIGGGRWTGEVQISFTKDPRLPQLKPITLAPRIFTVDLSTPTAAKILNCTNNSSSLHTGWPDVIKCTSGANTEYLYISHVQAATITYTDPYTHTGAGPGAYCINFNPDRSWKSSCGGAQPLAWVVASENP